MLLVLDNGVRIESRSLHPERSAGSYVLVVDADGDEIGYWNAEEWREDPEKVMCAILMSAARGRTAEKRQKVEPSRSSRVTLSSASTPDGRQLEPLRSVGPKQSGTIQEYEEKERKK